MNNLYREAFVFECAEAGRPFYLPKDGQMRLQFFHIGDMCRFMELLLAEQPEQRIFNVGDPETVTCEQWVRLCYAVLGKEPELRYVGAEVPQRSYFPFYDYEYVLDVQEMSRIMPKVTLLTGALNEAFLWWRGNRELIVRKPLLDFIVKNFG